MSIKTLSSVVSSWRYFFYYQEIASWHAHNGCSHIAQQCLSPRDPWYQRHSALNALEGVRLHRQLIFHCDWRVPDFGRIKMSVLRWRTGSNSSSGSFFAGDLSVGVAVRSLVQIPYELFLGSSSPLLRTISESFCMKKHPKCLNFSCCTLYVYISNSMEHCPS